MRGGKRPTMRYGLPTDRTSLTVVFSRADIRYESHQESVHPPLT
jgi:hypothetical protein